MEEKIVTYLLETYRPRAVLLYGSYARGDADEYSDFDCMILVDKKDKKHDDTVIGGVPLDCFIYTAEEAETGDIDLFLPACDARIVVDDGIGEALRSRVREYAREKARTDPEEKAFIVSWYRKTLRRMEKNDDEGNYRAVTLLSGSMEDYCLLRDIRYLGSKWALAYLKENDPAGYRLCHAAVTRRALPDIAAWAKHITEV